MPESQPSRLMPAISRYLASPLFLHPGQDRGVTALAQMCRLSLLPPILLSLKTEIGKAWLSTAEHGKNSSVYSIVVKVKGSDAWSQTVRFLVGGSTIEIHLKKTCY